jgi:hypothetical protein
MARNGWFRESQRHSLASRGIKTQPFSTRVKMPPNPIELAVIVPGTLGEDTLISPKQLKRRIHINEARMKDLFGGYTEVNGEGAWVNPKTHEETQEPDGVIKSFTTAKDYKEHQQEFAALVRKMKKDYKQKQIAFEFKNKLYFYPEPPKEEKK